MTTFAFSQHFNQRWSDSPQPVRHAITQELTDIIHLLQPDTSLDEFEFAQENLQEHIDELYRQHKMGFTQVRVKVTKTQSVTEVADENSVQVVSTNDSISQIAEQAEHEKDNDEVSVMLDDDDMQNTSLYETNLNENGITVEAVVNTSGSDGINDVDISSNQTSNDVAHSNAVSGSENSHVNDHATIVLKQLEQYIDDIIHDELDTLASNLKLWLRDEVSKRLSETN